MGIRHNTSRKLFAAIEQLMGRFGDNAAGSRSFASYELEYLEPRIQLSNGLQYWEPYAVRNMYGLNNPTVNYGNPQGNSGLTGAGQTIAIVVAYDDQGLPDQVNAFSNLFGLPIMSTSSDRIPGDGQLTIYDQDGATGALASLPGSNATWTDEEAMDVEWTHVVAPLANIDVVEANSGRVSNLSAAIETAENIQRVSVISMSFLDTISVSKFDESLFSTPAGHLGSNGQPGGITFVAASGDNGEWSDFLSHAPAASPYVLAVGGSSINESNAPLLPGNGYQPEVGWSNSGGGYATEDMPTLGDGFENYQKQIQNAAEGPAGQVTLGYESQRYAPDVAWLADNVEIVDGINQDGSGKLNDLGGTSLAAPMWAGLIADINAAIETVKPNFPTLYGWNPSNPSIGQALPLLYHIAKTDPNAFHDITSGGNGYPMNSRASYPLGYDLSTGLGTPNVPVLVSDFVHDVTGQEIYVNANAVGANNGTDWNDAFTTLQPALAEATAGDVIEMEPGTYFTTQSEGDTTATFQLEDGVTIDDADGPDYSSDPVILFGDGISYHVVTASGTNYTAQLIGVEITGGDASAFVPASDGSASYSPESVGGGIFNVGGSPTITDCTIEGDEAEYAGGGMWNSQNAEPVITGCNFDYDTAWGYGGGIANQGSSPILLDSNMANNFLESEGTGGGGLYDDSSSPTLTNCNFASEQVDLYNVSSSPLFTDCIFSGGGGLGYDIYNESSSASFINCTINPGWNSGGIYNASSSPTLTNCIIWNLYLTVAYSVDSAIENVGSSNPIVTYSDICGGYGGANSTNIDSDPLFYNEIPDYFSEYSYEPPLALHAGSPCMNMGNNAAIEATGISLDAAGNPRIAEGTVDMGAYEDLTVNWTGSGDGSSWNDPANWQGDAVPDDGFENVTIPAGATVVASSNTSVDVNELDIYAGASLTLAGDCQVNSYMSNGGTIIVSGTNTTIDAMDLPGNVTVTGDATLYGVGGTTLTVGDGASAVIVPRSNYGYPEYVEGIDNNGSLQILGQITLAEKSVTGSGTLIVGDGESSNDEVSIYQSGSQQSTIGSLIVNGGSEFLIRGGLLSVSGGIVDNGTAEINAGTAGSPVVIGNSTGADITGSGTLGVGVYYPSGFVGNGCVQLASNGALSTIGELLVTPSSMLDITNNTVAINYGSNADPSAAIRGYLVSGYNGDTWTGPGIVSSIAAANPGLYAVGYVDGNTDLGTPAAANQILIKNTIAGDANLDGKVNFADLLAVAQNFNHTLDTHGNPIDWADGDFNYDGNVNFSDLLLIAQNFNKQLAAGQVTQLPGSFSSDWTLAEAIANNPMVWVADSDQLTVQGFDMSGNYMSEFGGWGTGDGNFLWPNGITTDSKGNVWVADTGANLIEEFSPAGVFIGQFGSAGSGLGQLNSPYGIVVDPNGNVWVADTNNNRVQEFTGTGTFIQMFGGYGSGNGQFVYASALAIDANGNVWVADYGNCRVEEFSSNGLYESQFGGYGSGNGQLFQPRGIAIDASGNIWVTDSGNDRVEEFSGSGIYLSQFGSYGSGSGEFDLPCGIAIDSNGNIWVADYRNDRIEEFSGAGLFILSFGCAGTGDGQFNGPYGVAVD
jgi:streptogramin lyase